MRIPWRTPPPHNPRRHTPRSRPRSSPGPTTQDRAEHTGPAAPLCRGLLIGLLVVASPVVVPASWRPSDGEPDEGIVMRWSTPAEPAGAALSEWHERHAPQLAGVETAWAVLLRRMSGHRPARFSSQCEGLAASLRRLDEPELLPVPDPVVDLYVKRLLRHLQHAARACREQQLFNVVYHLEEARAGLGEMRWLLARRGLGDPEGPD